MNDETIEIKDTGIENLLSEMRYNDSILYLGGRIDDDNLYPPDYIKYLNQKIKELNPKHIICHSHWYAWKYYERGILDKSMKIDTIVCNYYYFITNTFDPINKEDYQGSHLWCINSLIEKNPNIVFALYDPNNKQGSVTVDMKWFERETRNFLEYDNFKYFTFDRKGDHGRNCTDGFGILTNLLKLGFKKINIIGFTAFGSNEDDSNFTKYTTSQDTRVVNKTYFKLETSEDQRAEADILNHWSKSKKIFNVENYQILTKHSKRIKL